MDKLLQTTRRTVCWLRRLLVVLVVPLLVLIVFEYLFAPWRSAVMTGTGLVLTGTLYQALRAAEDGVLEVLRMSESELTGVKKRLTSSLPEGVEPSGATDEHVQMAIEEAGRAGERVGGFFNRAIWNSAGWWMLVIGTLMLAIGERCPGG